MASGEIRFYSGRALKETDSETAHDVVPKVKRQVRSRMSSTKGPGVVLVLFAGCQSAGSPETPLCNVIISSRKLPLGLCGHAAFYYTLPPHGGATVGKFVRLEKNARPGRRTAISRSVRHDDRDGLRVVSGEVGRTSFRTTTVATQVMLAEEKQDQYEFFVDEQGLLCTTYQHGRRARTRGFCGNSVSAEQTISCESVCTRVKTEKTSKSSFVRAPVARVRGAPEIARIPYRRFLISARQLTHRTTKT